MLIELEAVCEVQPVVTVEQNFMELDCPGVITIRLDDVGEELRQMMDVPPDTEHRSLWDEFELAPVLPDEHGEIKLSLVRRDTCDPGAVWSRLHAVEMNLRTLAQSLTGSTASLCRQLAGEVFDITNGAPL